MNIYNYIVMGILDKELLQIVDPVLFQIIQTVWQGEEFFYHLQGEREDKIVMHLLKNS